MSTYYIVKLISSTEVTYFSGIYFHGVYTESRTTNRNQATELSADQAHRVGVYYAKVYKYDYEIQRKQG